MVAAKPMVATMIVVSVWPVIPSLQSINIEQAVPA
jgi:hypothetical protein